MKTNKILMTLVAFFFLTNLTRAAEQKLPGCSRLSHVWVTSYYYKLKPNWPNQPLNCTKDPSQYTTFERINTLAARTAYVLDQTVFYRNEDLPQTPIVSWGRIQAPPKSMLDWVAARIGRLIYSETAGSAAGGTGRDGVGEIILTPADFNLGDPMDSGIGLSAQIIHEVRHVGYPRGTADYGHVRCTGQNFYGCDETISEEFDFGGSHGVAALWMAWIYKYSSWPTKERIKAEQVSSWVLKNRINASYEIKNAFSLRYFNKTLK